MRVYTSLFFFTHNPDSQFPGSPLVLTVIATSVPATVTNTPTIHLCGHRQTMEAKALPDNEFVRDGRCIKGNFPRKLISFFPILLSQ